MGFELDPLEDILSDETVKNVRAGGKFQPKAKPRAPKKVSATTLVPSTELNQTSNMVIDKKSNEASQFEEQVEQNKHKNISPAGLLTETVSSIERTNLASDLLQEEWVDMPDSNVDQQPCFEKSVAEKPDIFIGLESLEENVSVGLVPLSETAAPNVPIARYAEDRLSTPVFSSANDSADMPNFSHDSEFHETSATHDPLTRGECIIPGSYKGDQFVRAEVREMDTVDTLGQRMGKFLPKTKIQSNADQVEPASYPQDSCSVLSETGFLDKASIHGFQNDDFLDLVSIGFCHDTPPESTSELPTSENPINLTGATQLDSGGAQDLPETVPEMPVKLVSRRPKAKSHRSPTASDAQKVATFEQESEIGRSLRPLEKRTNTCHFQDDSEGELDDKEGSAEGLSDSVVNEDVTNVEEFQAGTESQMKKVRGKSKKPTAGRGKPVRKRKKADEASDQATEAKPKKFPHSTRRKRRKVDKTLLETPEDEIDFQKVPLRDLILLAEHKERLAKKSTTLETLSAHQSICNPFARQDEDEAVASEPEDEFIDEQASPTVAEEVFINYQTYMDKTPRTRWSKQDTELFYEAVRQFGTDLSLIQQLFPGITRRQVKLKYKKEERQHPMRLREALTNRAKDHSHFQRVIERLRKIAEEENQTSNKDDSIDLTGHEDMEAGTSETNALQEEEVKNAEEVEGKKEEDIGEDQNPDHDEDEFLFDWSQYKSEV